MRVIRKLSAKTLGYNQSTIKQLLRDAKGKPVHLYNLAGKVRGIKIGEHTNGTWTAFVGEFVGIPVAPTDQAEIGDHVMSPKAFLHDPMQGLLIAALESDNEKEVEFSVEVFVVPNETTTGYEYEERPVVKIKETDSLSHLVESFKPVKQIESKSEKASKK